MKSYILTNFLPMEYYHFDMKSYPHQVIFSPISCQWNIIIMIWSHILTNFLSIEYYHYDMKSYSRQFLANGILSLWYEVIFSPITCQWNTIIMIWVISSQIFWKWNTIIMVWSHILTNFLPMEYYHYDMKSYSHQFLVNGIQSLWYEVIFSPISC